MNFGQSLGAKWPINNGIVIKPAKMTQVHSQIVRTNLIE